MGRKRDKRFYHGLSRTVGNDSKFIGLGNFCEEDVDYVLVDAGSSARDPAGTKIGITVFPFNPAQAQTYVDLIFDLGICGRDGESKSTTFPSKLRRREFFVYFFAEKK